MQGYELFEELISLSNYKPYTINNHKYLINREIINKYDKTYYNIVAISTGGVIAEIIDDDKFFELRDYIMITFDSLFNNYRYYDGGIIGKKIKKQNGKK